MRVLIVEDNEEIAAFIAGSLAKLGHAADIASSGGEGLRLVRQAEHDVIVVDRMLPDQDGIEMVRAIRREGRETPVLFLTNLSGIDDRVEGLEAGGDDYLVKPFAIAEFTARLVALARRASLGDRNTILAASDLEMDLIKRTVRRGGKEIELQPREFPALGISPPKRRPHRHSNDASRTRLGFSF
jgi:two-component system, OmpR family, response regulator